jgi:hypothetical protein
MTINEKRQLSNYIKGIVRESLGEMDSMPSWWNDEYGYDDETDGFDNDEIDDYDYSNEEIPDEHNDFWEEMGKSQPGRHYEGPDVDGNDDPVYADEPDDDEIAGINELRQLAESYARQSVAQILYEKKGGWKKKGKKGTKKSKGEKKKSSSEKTLMDHLNNDSVNAAHYYYKLYNAKSDAEKAAARSLGYKKAKGEKTPNKRSHYRFTPKERNKLNAMLTADNN